MTKPQDHSDPEEKVTNLDPRGPRENQNKKDEDESEDIMNEDDFTLGAPRGGK